MRSPIMTTITQAEPIIDPREFGHALDRVSAALHYCADRAGALVEGRKVRVRLLPRRDDLPALAVGTLLVRNEPISEPTC